MWNDRKRKKYYIALQHELTQKRVDTMLLKEEEVSESNKEHIDKKRSELTEQQIQLCISVLKTTSPAKAIYHYVSAVGIGHQ